MKFARRIQFAVALFCASAASWAADVYTSPDLFLAQLKPGAYTETFNGIESPTSPATFSGGAFSYTVSADGDLYASGEFLGTNLPDEALTITFTSGNVNAVGGNFYATNLSDEFQAVEITLNLSDGTTVSFTPTSASDSFVGFIATSFITSLVIEGPGTSLYAGIDNLTVGTTVPEPATWLLMGLGAAGLLLVRRRAA